jgi:abequosyltransferase
VAPLSSRHLTAADPIHAYSKSQKEAVSGAVHMPEPVLTIIIPTYNRSKNLRILLRVLREETSGLRDDVAVIVSDNASPDDTPQVVAEAANGWPTLVSYRHQANVGPENNFLHGVRAVRTRWFWILGDDDLPKRGLIAKIVTLLRERQPALVYMQSEWVKLVERPEQGRPMGELQIANLDALNFAKAIHVWVTYISGIIIDRERLEFALQGQSIDRYNATSLVHLGWVLPIFRTTGPFIIVRNDCILATAGNTGGYNLLRVFGRNFQHIVKESFQGKEDLKSIGDSIILRTNIHYLPGLLRAYARGTVGEFEKTQNIDGAFDEMFVKSFYYRLILKPILEKPSSLGLAMFVACKMAGRMLSIYDKIWQRIELETSENPPI